MYSKVLHTWFGHLFIHGKWWKNGKLSLSITLHETQKSEVLGYFIRLFPTSQWAHDPYWRLCLSWPRPTVRFLTGRDVCHLVFIKINDRLISSKADITPRIVWTNSNVWPAEIQSNDCNHPFWSCLVMVFLIFALVKSELWLWVTL